MRLSLLALAVVALALPATSASSVPAKTFQQCGDFPADFTWNLRVDGVGCSRGKKVSERYYRATVEQQQANVRFGSWRCKSESYGDGGNVKCKNKPREVRFAMGG